MYIKNRKLVIVGDGEFGEIAYEYFMLDSDYEVVAFAVEREFRKKETLFSLPVIDFESIAELYPADIYYTFVAVTYVKMNIPRTRLYLKCKALGYTCASFISSHAFVWHNVSVGENTFIFEDNTIQYHVSIGNNVILWSGNHIGHRTVIEDNCWLTSHVVVSGFCRIGQGSFIGVNAALGDNVVIAKEVVLGAGALTVRNLEQQGQVYIGNPARLLNRTSYEQFDVEDTDVFIE